MNNLLPNGMIRPKFIKDFQTCIVSDIVKGNLVPLYVGAGIIAVIVIAGLVIAFRQHKMKK